VSDLCQLVVAEEWSAALSHLCSLTDIDAVDQLFFQHVIWGDTALMLACNRSAPLAFIQLMIAKAKLDPIDRCLLAIASHYGFTALYCAAYYHTDPAVLELLIRSHPLAPARSADNRQQRSHAPPARHHHRHF